MGLQQLQIQTPPLLPQEMEIFSWVPRGGRWAAPSFQEAGGGARATAGASSSTCQGKGFGQIVLTAGIEQKSSWTAIHYIQWF